MTIAVGSLYAGVGGIDLGFSQAGAKVDWANELDPHAVRTYIANHDSHMEEGDVAQIEPLARTDILTAGIPCQPFSHAFNHHKGFEDARGTAFFDVMRWAAVNQPEIIFIENVANFRRHDQGRTLQIVRTTMENEGYKVFDILLNTCHCTDIPQNRERTFIIGYRDSHRYQRFINEYDSRLCDPPPMLRPMTDLLETGPVNERYYYREDRSYYAELSAGVKSRNIMYQWRRSYVRQNKKGLCPTLTANCGTGGNNLPIILTDHGIRRLTPREAFNFQGFPDTFVLPQDSADSHLYKQAGNSVTVPVINKLARLIVATY